MILVDTSVWIELLNGKLGAKVAAEDLLQFVTCGPILQEVFQGVKDVPQSKLVREAFLAIPRLDDPVPLRTFLEV